MGRRGDRLSVQGGRATRVTSKWKGGTELLRGRGDKEELKWRNTGPEGEE